MSNFIRATQFVVGLLFAPLFVFAESIDEKISFWESELAKYITPGLEREAVSKYLIENNLKHTYSEVDKTFYAIDRDVDNWKLIYSAAVLIRIKLTDNELVKEFELEREFTGL